MVMAIASIMKTWHIFVGIFGSALNISLLLLAAFKSPKLIRMYSILIINFAVTDLLVCLLDVFIEIRLLPSPNEATMTYILNGFCAHFGQNSCTIGLSLHIHFLTHSVWSLFISFAYRYYAMFSASLKPQHIATYWLNFVDHDTIYPIAQRVYPEYNITEEVGDGLLTGITNLFTVSAVYALGHMVIPTTPIYISIFYFRRNIIKILMRNHGSMSKETKAVHSQLLKALTCQAVIPVAAWTAVYIYIAMQFSIIRGRFFEYAIFSTIIFMPILSPITYLVFVRPYRMFIVRMFCRISRRGRGVEDKGRTQFQSTLENSIYTTAATRKF